MNTLFKINYERKRSRCDKSIHKPMIFLVGIYQINKDFSATVQPKNECKSGFADHLWLPFLDQPQSDIVVFSIINFQIYKILVKNGNMEKVLPI